MNSQIIYLIFVAFFMCVLLWKVHVRGAPRDMVVFITTLSLLGGFYLIHFGELDIFNFKSALASIELIKNKKEEIRQDAEEISQVKNQIKKILKDSHDSQEIISKAQEKILSLEKGLVKITKNSATKKDLDLLKSDFEELDKASREEWNKVRPKEKEFSEKSRKDNLVMQVGQDKKQIEYMGQKIAASVLADKARWYLDNGGDYESYYLLWEIMGQNDHVKEFIKNELIEINKSLRLSYSSVARVPLCKHGRNIGNRCLEVETKDDFSVSNVISQLFHPTYWVSRAKSAYLLQFLTQDMMKKDNSTAWKKVLGELYKSFAPSVENKNNLLTRYLAWEAFRKHTCFAKDDELFNAESTITWWENQENQSRTLEVLENGLASPFCE